MGTEDLGTEDLEIGIIEEPLDRNPETDEEEPSDLRTRERWGNITITPTLRPYITGPSGELIFLDENGKPTGRAKDFYEN